MMHYFKQRFKRSQQDRVIGGVCGGFGDYFCIDPLVVRLIFVALTFSPFPIFLFYILMWFLAPLNEVEIKNTESDKFSNE